MIEEDSPVCQRVFKLYGRCVDIAEAKDFIENKSKETAEKFNIKSQVDHVYELMIKDENATKETIANWEKERESV